MDNHRLTARMGAMLGFTLIGVLATGLSPVFALDGTVDTGKPAIAAANELAIRDGLVSWFKASALADVTDVVKTAKDTQGNALTAVTGMKSRRVLYSPGTAGTKQGDALTFQGWPFSQGACLQYDKGLAGADFTKGVTIIALVKPTGGAADEGIWGTNYSNAPAFSSCINMIYDASNKSLKFAYGIGVMISSPKNSCKPDTLAIYAITDDADGKVKIFINDTALATDQKEDARALLTAVHPRNTAFIGCRAINQDLYSFNGDICELIVYSRALPAADLAKVNTYLNGKYGISKP